MSAFTKPYLPETRLSFSMLVGLLLSICIAPAYAATTLHVSPTGDDNNSGTATAPYKTIQAALNNAAAGDTVLLAGGTYTGNGNRDLDFSGKNITLSSQNGSDKTILDCGGSETKGHRAFYFHSKETAAIVGGLTILHGTMSGAITVNEGCTIKIAHCALHECIGGAIVCGGKLSATDCTISNNPDVGVSGGYITMDHCIISNNARGGVDGGLNHFSNCTIANNKGQLGAGVHTHGNITRLENCAITGNVSRRGGGGCLGDFGGTIVMDHCTVSDNTAQSGAGVYGGMMLTSCVIRHNTAAEGGGGVYGSGYLRNCLIADNTTAEGNGGGIKAGNRMDIEFCTIVGNSAKGAEAQGGAIEYDNDLLVLTDSIIWDNSAPNAPEIGVGKNERSKIKVTYCDIQGGLSGAGNIKTDPLFVDPANGNFHLKAGSPCTGIGVNIPMPVVLGVTNADPKLFVVPKTAISSDMEGKPHSTPPSLGTYEAPRPGASAK